MSRRVACSGQLLQSAQHALQLVHAGEMARNALSAVHQQHVLHFRHLERLYEAAYLRAFSAWEDFVEGSFLRYLCGYRNSSGAITLRQGTYQKTLQAAFGVVAGGRSYMLWHDASKVVQRARVHFVNSPHETVIASHLSALTEYGRVRHRIAHAHQQDARANFDLATRALVGRTLHGSRAGSFLREFVRGNVPPCRWIERILSDLGQLAVQVEA